METDGVVALYDNEMILTLYSSTAGGYTESYANAFSDLNTKTFPSEHKPYLVAVPDREEFPKLNDEEKAFIEMVLEIDDSNILSFIRENNIDLEFDNEIIISREITQNSTKTRDLTKLLVRKLLKNTKKELSLLIESPKSLKVVRE